jgi:hypothetical protein
LQKDEGKMIFNLILGFLILLFLFALFVNLVWYFIRRLRRPQEKIRFPIWSAIIFFFCCGFYIVAFLFEYITSNSGNFVATPTRVPTIVRTNTPNVNSSVQEAAQRSNCIQWADVSSAMIGKVNCVYGTVHRTRFVGESTFQILFSSNPQDFFLAGGTYNYNVGSGDCVVAKGEILTSSTGVPYIDIDEGLFQCESWMK